MSINLHESIAPGSVEASMAESAMSIFASLGVTSLAVDDGNGGTTVLASIDEQPLEITPEQTETAVAHLIKDGTDLVNRTVFLRVRFGSIGNSRKVSGDVLETDADVTLLQVHKKLLDSPEFDAIKKADGKMRQWLYNTCLPFEMGVLLLPIGLIDAAVAKMDEYKKERAALVEAFIVSFPAQCEEIAKRLGTQYASTDYPTVDEIRQKFTFDYNIMSFSVPGHLQTISKALFDAEKEKQAAQIQIATEEITGLMRGTMLKLVQHLQKKLIPGDDGKPKILKEAAVNNLTEFLNTFELRNVTDDSDLAAQVAKARLLLTGTDARSIRDSETLKTQLLSGLDSILDSLNGMVEEKPGRMFKDE